MARTLNESCVCVCASIFGALQIFVFSDAMLTLTTKCMIYQAVVLGVLLYAVETWPVCVGQNPVILPSGSCSSVRS